MRSGHTPESVDTYLAEVEADWARAALSHLRQLIREEAPQAEECISYGMPGYKFHGMLVYFAAFKNHCSFFPGGAVPRYADDLTGFKTSKGTIQFTEKNLLPDELVRRIVRDRVQENLTIADAKKKR